jgi:hypothetical protein
MHFRIITYLGNKHNVVMPGSKTVAMTISRKFGAT